MPSMEEENKSFLLQKSPSLYGKLYEEESQYPFLRTVQGEYGIKAIQEQVECHVSSIYNRQEELDGYFSETPSNTEYIVYVGWISPDVIQYIKKKFKRLKHLIFIEPAPQLLRENLKSNSLKQMLLQNTQIKVTVLTNMNAKDASSHMNQMIGMVNRLFVASTIAYKTLFSAYCAQFAEYVSEDIRHHLINLTTNNLYHIEWVKSQMKNYGTPVYSIESLVPLFHGQTVILVSAGPSLKKNIELLREVHNKALIIAVGSSVYILNKIKMFRHFNAGMDTKQPEFQSPDFPDVPLLLDCRLNPVTFERYTGPRVNFISASDYLGRYLCIDGENWKYVPDTGMSIAVSIASLVCKLGASKLIFVGQDMCFYEETVHYLDDKKEFHKEDLMQLTDIYGNAVMAQPAYWSIKRYLEGVIKKHTEVECINATEGGLGLDGAKNIPLRDVLETLPEVSESFEESIRRLLDVTEPVAMFSFWEKKAVAEDLKKIMDASQKGLESLKAIEALRKNGAANKKIDKQIAAAKKQLDKMQENKLFSQVVRMQMISVFQSLDMVYDSDANSPDWNKSTDAQIKKAIGGFVPVLQFCNAMNEAYTKWRTNNKEQLQKSAEASHETI